MEFRDLYPDYSEEHLKIAEENLLAYLEMVLETYKRIQEDPELYQQYLALKKERLELGFKPDGPDKTAVHHP